MHFAAILAFLVYIGPKDALVVLPTFPVPVARSRYRIQPVGLAAEPGGRIVCRTALGTPVRLWPAGKGSYALVSPPALPGLKLWVPRLAVGLRVQKTAALLGSPNARDVVGQIRSGSLVHLVRTRGRYALVNVLCGANIRLWIERRHLGTSDVPYAASIGHGGLRGAVSPGPVYTRPGGRVLGRILYPALARIRTRQRKKRRWLQVLLGHSEVLSVRVWVPSKRFSRVYRTAWAPYTFKPRGPTARRRPRPRSVALAPVPTYATVEDAFALWTIPAGTPLKLRPAERTWPNWRMLVFEARGLRCTFYTPWRPGLVGRSP